MVGSSLSTPLAGMSDVFGLELRKRRFVSAVLADVAGRYGYEGLEVPVIERAAAFDPEVVGRSPWPEWDERSCFTLRVPDYAAAYDDLPRCTDALLIPEGTVSVTRWLGNRLDEQPGFVFPVKLHYETPCFRNEPLSSVDATKRRQFDQAGLEVLGAAAGSADVEVIHLMATGLHELGLSREALRVRAGDVAVFNRLVYLSEIGAEDAIALKESLDAIAECKAGKVPERRHGLVARVEELLRRAGVEERWAKVWRDLARGSDSLPVIEADE